jgi:hypothetical protein
MTCIYCHQRKGKRSCPALGGPICSLCCGQHRLAEIPCPADCVYLGGLSVVRDPAPQGRASREALGTLIEKLVGHAERTGALREALGEVVVDGPEDWSGPLVVAHACYGYRDRQGRRVIDRFLIERGRDLSPAEAATLVCLQQAWLSLHRVERVHMGSGLDLVDLIQEEPVHVREISGSYQVQRGDVLCGWIMPLGDHHELTGAVISVPEETVEPLRRALLTAREEARRRWPDLPARQLLGESTGVVLRLISAALRDAPRPHLQNTDGHELVLCRAHYDLTDAEEARRRLRELEDLNEDDGTFVWLGQTRKGGPGPTVLGRIELDGAALSLSVNSRERLEKGKRLLGKALRGVARHRLDSLEDMDLALERAAEEGPGEPPDAPMSAEQAAAVGEYLRQHYTAWMDTRLPALGGKTPRKAVRTRAGREQVRALLDEMERRTLAMPGGETMDFTAIREELGLLEECDTPYDPAVAPDPAAWLGLDEQVRIDAALAYHRHLDAPHPPVPNLMLHAMAHVIVENQIASRDPREIGETVARLMAAGLSRHEAIHAVGSVVARWLFDVLQKKEAFDLSRSLPELQELRAADWMGQAR